LTTVGRSFAAAKQRVQPGQRVAAGNLIDVSVNLLCGRDVRVAEDFSRKLIKDRLAASAHNFAPVRSVYRWRGEIHERTEGRVSLHTRRSRIPEIVDRAKREHPYELPGVSSRPINDGNPDYLAWISEQTAPTP
jgi:periplasmic divalent cation tolerance protein